MPIFAALDGIHDDGLRLELALPKTTVRTADRDDGFLRAERLLEIHFAGRALAVDGSSVGGAAAGAQSGNASDPRGLGRLIYLATVTRRVGRTVRPQRAVDTSSVIRLSMFRLAADASAARRHVRPRRTAASSRSELGRYTERADRRCSHFVMRRVRSS